MIEHGAVFHVSRRFVMFERHCGLGVECHYWLLSLDSDDIVLEAGGAFRRSTTLEEVSHCEAGFEVL